MGGIVDFANKAGITAGAILSGVGCVKTARLRDATGVDIQRIDEHMEIVSVTGTVSLKRTHIHVSLSKKDLSVIGGHLVEGCIVNTTAEIVILALNDLSFADAFDPTTGYNELCVSNREFK